MMKIWLEARDSDAGKPTEASTDDCTDNDDCEGDYTSIVSADHLPSENEIYDVYARPLKQASPLYLHEFAPDRWLACAPVGISSIVVLDQHAKLLLDQFREAKMLATVQLKLTQTPCESLEQAVTLLSKHGLLQAVDASPIKHQSGKPGTLTAWLHVTNACNLRCTYCYLDKTTENMSADTAFQAVDAIFRSAVQQGFTQIRIKYAGGEASLRMTNVLSVHDYASRVAQEHGIELRGVLLSNGVVLAQRTIEQLQARRIRVMISLDGIGDYHDRQRPFKQGQGSFQYVDRTISLLLANGLVPSISVTLSQRNLAGLPDLVMYILKRELPFSLNYYRDNECASDGASLQFGEEQMIDALRAAYAVIEQHLPERSLMGSLIDKARLSSPHQHTCGVGHNYMVIDQYGGIAKCQADIKQTVTTIAARDPLRVIQADRTGVLGLPVEEKEGCRSCDWRYWCTGGCPLLTYRMTKRYDVKSPNCNIYMHLFPEVLRLEALRLLKYETPVSI